MKRVIKFETRDGVLHNDFLTAKRYAEVIYTDTACWLATKLVTIEKYQAMKDFIDANLDQFLMLKALKDDIILPPPEDDE